MQESRSQLCSSPFTVWVQSAVACQSSDCTRKEKQNENRKKLPTAMFKFSFCVSTFLAPLVYPSPLLLPKHMCSEGSVLGLLPSLTRILFTLSLSFLGVCFYLRIFGCAGSSLLRGFSSSCRFSSCFSSGGAGASHWSGFSSRKAQALGAPWLSSCRSWALEPRHRSCAARV